MRSVAPPSDRINYGEAPGPRFDPGRAIERQGHWPLDLHTFLNDPHTSLNDHHTSLNDHYTSLNDHYTLLNDQHTLLNDTHPSVYFSS